ncbi:opacity protein-like surface antigen [Parabacteroides sp. PF5-5]|uniref:outer membrane beta-barrel protein n=1 Tax=unclassified Parabacteroides TaxID=2649774 RepID=UPI00247598D8|nr:MULTISPECIES: outer membrane beta-barrel protein [unclassified Parabacteroides]MDH6305873.1 opacity protein-like surface antigen [Parabacteroides sp. PH5-39]MDH6317313.1 opacity protein-like surface antigen [Parabacteroides sp. PF5-13]MDH6320521.1 opacity protein-like surface antigen [Parabacteroides sp. PH5-13]MDH6324316.1 opacity protein-like surface antigen [Parabacteroides sp. PH5-8]MDH6328513.1 opacity protein-like surface antigen [Parabacteroides sp. PH5-41]
MKRIVVLLMLVVFSLGVHAQNHKGDSSFGLNLGYGFDSENVTLGLDYRINFTDAVRFAPSITHFVKDNGLSAWMIDVNAHYVFPLSEYFGFYPLAGLSLGFWKASAGGWSHNDTRFGANLGLGGEVYASKEITLGLEVKYNIVKDIDQALIAFRVGYNF